MSEQCVLDRPAAELAPKEPVAVEDPRAAAVSRLVQAKRENTALSAESSIDTSWFALTVALSESRAWGANAGRLFYAVYVKRAIDMAVAGLALLVLAPVMLLIAIAIRLESEGPVLFRQERIGLGGRSFTMYKFRSMRADQRSGSERRTKNRSGDRRRTHKSVNDPRVTVTGKLIRRTSLDELPQLWNVLRGDMSLIGPRPELPKIVARYAPWQHYRHVVRPGITGWWQVNGRSDRPLHENTEIDLYYIEHLSLVLDLKILALTPKAVLSMAGAF